MEMCHIRRSADIDIFFFSGIEEKNKRLFSHYGTTECIFNLQSQYGSCCRSSITYKACLSQVSIFFCSSTYIQAGLAPAKNMFNTALIFKYWSFIFEYCLSVLAKKVDVLNFLFC